MFKKRKQNLRQRRKSDSDKESGDDSEVKSDAPVQSGATQIWDVKIEPDTSVKTKKKKTKTGPTGDKSVTSVLSFADEEEHDDTEEFKIKKSSRSERIARKLKKASRKEKEAEEAAKKQKEEQDRKMKYDYRPESPMSDVGRGSDFESDDDNEEDGGHAFRSVLESGAIPDANIIHMARKRRQMARDMQDYIPIAETKRNKNAEKSRLVREENDDDDEDEPVPFSEHTHNRERQRMRDEFLAAEHGSGDSDSDKDNWEAQQIKKAMNIPQVNPSAGQAAVVASYVPAYTHGRDTASPSTIKAMYENVDETSSHIPAALNSAKQEWNLDELCNRLRESMSTLESVHRAHQREKEKTDDDVALNEKTVKDGEASAPLLEKRYRFFQQMRGYVRDLILCHNEKLPTITDLENSYLALIRERAALRVKRRQQDVKDQATDYNPMKEKRPAPAMDTPRQRRAAEREARKGRRRRARESINIIGHYDGLSTDDEQTQSDLTKFNSERDRIREARDCLYDDVLDDFCKLSKLAEQFEEWKFEHGDSYTDAYIGLCLPKLFSPLLKLELIDWNPLEAASCSMERLGWYSCLIGYGRSARIDPDDVDLKLVPSVVEKFVVPRLTVLAECVWDPLSKQETLLFVSCIERIATEYPISSDSKNMQLLVKALVERIKKCIDEDIFMPLYPKEVLDKKFSPAAVFFSRQLWSCIKLFRNSLMWHRVIAPSVLKQLACEALLNRYIILGLSNSLNNHLIERCQMIAEAIPKVWFEEVSDDATFIELDKFCRFLVNVAMNLDRLRASMSEHDAYETRQKVQTIQKLLVNLHSMDHAMEVAHHCSLKLDR